LRRWSRFRRYRELKERSKVQVLAASASPLHQIKVRGTYTSDYILCLRLNERCNSVNHRRKTDSSIFRCFDLILLILGNHYSWGYNDDLYLPRRSARRSLDREARELTKSAANRPKTIAIFTPFDIGRLTGDGAAPTYLLSVPGVCKVDGIRRDHWDPSEKDRRRKKARCLLKGRGRSTWRRMVREVKGVYRVSEGSKRE